VFGEGQKKLRKVLHNDAPGGSVGHYINNSRGMLKARYRLMAVRKFYVGHLVEQKRILASVFVPYNLDERRNVFIRILVIVNVELTTGRRFRKLHAQ
jgi:hypothetical protein